ncbi:MAG: PEGA domain-containing protein [Proteobacteria bacterium]|nr:PEGA domain-containing protein [Pseudomonadota bacterium]
MKHSFLSISSAACAIIGALLLCSNAYADNNEELFSKYMYEGIDHYKAGSNDPNEFLKAIEAFEKAKTIDPIPDISYNIARSYQQLGNCEKALENYREYAITSAENAEAVKEHIQTLSNQCGKSKGSLTVKCAPENAKVRIDGADPVACQSTYELATGEHTLMFIADNYKTETRTIEITTDNQKIPKNVVVEMTSAVDNTTAERELSEDMISGNEDLESDDSDYEEAAPAGPVSKPGILFWSGVGTTGGGVLLTIIGAAVLGTAHDPITINRFDAYERNTGKQAGGGVLLGLGIAATLGGATMIILDRLLPPKDNTQSFRVAPAISVTPETTSATLTMTF